jgi:Spy/CpxP family protein refolding chaperone
VSRGTNVLVAMALTAGVASAAPQGRGPGADGQPPHRREDIGPMIDAYMISNLQESLGLSDEQFVKVLPLMKRLQQDRRERMQEHHQLLREMRGQLQSGKATEPHVLELLAKLKALEVEERENGRRNREAIDAVLSPLQQAKLRVLEVEMDQRIRELLSEARRRHGAPPDAPRHREETPPAP